MSQTIVITAEQQDVLSREATSVLMLDDRGVATHLALPIDEARRVFDDYVRRELNLAFEEATREPMEPWDIEATIAEAHRRHR
jgi:hypothetical protein